jgi:hypothetical protein
MRFSAEYANGMSNHLPMASVAIERLGAPPERVSEFIEFYTRRLRPMDAEEAAQSDRLHDELAREGRESFLRKHVAKLTPGIAAAAFHGVIRTAYAVDTDDVADAIGAWLWEYATIDVLRGSRDDPFRSVQRDDRFGERLKGSSIVGRIGQVVAMPAFREYGFGRVTLEELARIAVQIYLATADFTALHMVTGCHAARVLAPYLADDALEHLATALLAAYITIGRLSFGLTEHDAPDWDTIAKIAIASNDDHDLKMVYSCREEDAVYGWGLHRMAAARRVGLLGF